MNEAPNEKKTVVITGASSGIGRACALELARAGFRVLAGVRKAADGDALRAAVQGELATLTLDVTDRESIREAAARTEELTAGQGLDGLVNNAGISISGPLEILPMDMFERQMRVNVDGQVAVTQAFLPALRKARGRIVFISSESGRFTLPLLGAYSASKHALEAVANALRLELATAGVAVSSIEPGSIKSEIWRKADDWHARLLAEHPALAQLYSAELDVMMRMPRQAARSAIEPEAVARVVLRALTARRPRARYLVGADARVLTTFFALTPTPIADFVVTRAMRLLSRSTRRRSAD